MVGGMHGRGACVAMGSHGREAYLAEGVHGGGACVAGGMHGRGACMPNIPPSRYYEIRSMSGRYISYGMHSYFTMLFCS